jgi:hypothetical protein
MFQARGEAKLLAAIINRAILDCCGRPIKRKYKKNPDLPEEEQTSSDTREAFRFIFNDEGMAKIYLEFLNLDIKTFRHKLLKTMFDETIKIKPDTDKLNKRAFRYNYNQFRHEELKTQQLKEEMLKWKRVA